MKPRPSNNKNSRRAALRDCAVLISATVFILGGALSAMLMAHYSWGVVFSTSHVVSNPVAIGGIVIMLLALAIGGYLAIVLWIICARYVFRFTQTEVRRGSRSGPRVPLLSALDDYLIKRIYRGTNDDA